MLPMYLWYNQKLKYSFRFYLFVSRSTHFNKIREGDLIAYWRISRSWFVIRRFSFVLLESALNITVCAALAYNSGKTLPVFSLIYLFNLKKNRSLLQSDQPRSCNVA
jgi:hypothetical protein